MQDLRKVTAGVDAREQNMLVIGVETMPPAGAPIVWLSKRLSEANEDRKGCRRYGALELCPHNAKCRRFRVQRHIVVTMTNH